MSRWSAVTTAWTGLSLLCDVIQWMSGWRLRCACMQSAAWTHHSEPHLTACQVRGGKNTHHSREETRPAEFPPASHHLHPTWGGGFSRSASLSHTSHASFLWINRVPVLTHRWQRNRGSKLLRNQTDALLNKICCDWTWIRRNRRLHGW